MTYVVTDGCRDCRHTECVAVCPVECFHLDDRMTYIDPDTCIDCGGCVPVCPEKAIFPSWKMPTDKVEWVEINRVRAAETPVLSAKLPPLVGSTSP